MKIAILTETINRKSGARSALEIAKALKEQKHQVTIFAYDRQLELEVKKELEEKGIHVKTFASKNRPLICLKLAKILKKEKFDVINFHGTLAFFLAALTSRIPIVRSYHGSQLDAYLDRRFPRQSKLVDHLINYLANKMIIYKEKFVLKNSALVLGISQYTGQELKKLFGLKTSSYVYHGAKPATFKKAVRKKKKEINIVSVSRIVPYKGFHRLIRVFNQLKKRFPQINLTIIGSSPNHNYLNYLKKIAGPGVEFKINISDKDLIAVYQQADIYASFDHYMFFGMPLLEAASFSLPSVVIKRCAAKELIKPAHTGFLAKNEKEFKQSLAKLIKNPGLRKKLGRQAQKWAKNFTWQRSAKQYLKFFEKAKKNAAGTYRWSLIVILLLGILLRLAFINRHAFWFDEAVSYSLAHQPLILLLQQTAADSHPPFYYLLLKLWLSVSPKVCFLRLLSLIFGVISIPLVYKICQKLTNTKTALLASAIFALSPLHIYFSTETRMYSLFVSLTLASIYIFLKILKKPKKIYFLLFTFYSLLSLYTHYYAVFVLLALNIAFLAKVRKYKKFIVSWTTCQLLIFLGFLPWLIFAYKSANTSCWCFPPLVGLPAMFASFAIGGMGVVTLKDFYLYGPKLPLSFCVLTAIFAFLLFLRGIWAIRKSMTKNFSILSFFFVPLLTAILMAFFLPLFSPRSLIVILPLYYLLTAVGALSIKKRLTKNLSILALLALFFTTLAFQFFDPFFYGPPLKKAADFIDKNYQKEEAVFHLSPMTFYPFQYFHKFSYPEFLAILPETSSGTIFEIGNFQKPIEEIVLKYNKVWVINLYHWVSPERVNKVKQLFPWHFVLDQEVHYNSIEVLHYTRK